VIYLSAGLYAEGPSDYQFLCPLVDRFMEEIAAALFPGILSETRGPMVRSREFGRN